jgi:hypothetical protein
MIRKAHPLRGLDAGFDQTVFKPSWISDATECGNLLASKHAQGLSDTIQANPIDRALDGFHPDGIWSHSPKLLSESIPILRRDGIGPRECYRAGSAAHRDRFAQRTARQQVAVAEGLECVDNQKIETPAESAVLKTIIQQDHIGKPIVVDTPCCCDSVSVRNLNDFWNQTAQLVEFVIGSRSAGLVTPTEDSDSKILPVKPMYQPPDHRRLARSADG